MESWIRAERLLLCAIGVVWVAVVAIAIDMAQIKPVVAGIGEPASVVHSRGVTRITYVLNDLTPAERESLKSRLQIRGYKTPPNSWPGLLMKDPRDFVHLYDGTLTIHPNGTRSVSYVPNRTTLVRTVRQRTFASAWYQLRREWRQRERSKAQKTALVVRRPL
jgi:hypothetical protein